MIWVYISAFVIAFLLSIVLTPWIKKVAKHYNIIDKPAERRIHKKPIPRLGGFAFFSAFLISIVAFAALKPEYLTFYEKKILGIDQHLIGVIIGALILVCVGIWDDVKELGPWKKFFWQIIAALIVVGSGIGIATITNPFGQDISLSNWQIPIQILGKTRFIIVWADLFAVCWIVVMINIVNFLDGLDGLAAGISGIAAFVLFFLSVSVGQPAVALVSIILAGSVIGFLPYNFYPAKIFMGDSGSQFLGYILAVAAIISGGKVTTLFLVLGVAVLDFIWVIARRIVGGKAPWLADKKHLHHRLLSIGLSQSQTVLLLYFISILLGIAALLSGSLGKFWEVVTLVVFMLILSLILVTVEWKNKGVSK